jgi:Kef-type K+ transport system membrane component KefB
VRVARNIAIIALLALVVAAAPGGGNAATAIVTTISIAFLAAIAFAVYQAYRQNQFTWMALTDGQRGQVVVAVGLVALMIAGTDELLGTGLGTLAWIAGLGIAVALVWRVWLEARSA